MPPVQVVKLWMSTPYTMDGFNSLAFVVEGLNACHWGLAVEKVEEVGVDTGLCSQWQWA